MKESNLQAGVRKWAYGEYGKFTVDHKGRHKSGLIRILKLSTLGMYGEGGWMDLCFWVVGAYVFLIEMKVPGNDLSDLQSQRKAELIAMGFHVYTKDNAQEAKETIRAEVDAAVARWKASQKSTKRARR